MKCPTCGLEAGFHQDDPEAKLNEDGTEVTTIYLGHRYERENLDPKYFLPKKGTPEWKKWMEAR